MKIELKNNKYIIYTPGKILIRTIPVANNNSNIINTYLIYMILDDNGKYKFSLEVDTLQDPIEEYDPDEYSINAILTEIMRIENGDYI